MQHYFVKTHFSGWQEVSPENYNSFIENFKIGATGMKESKKADYLKTITRIEDDEK